MTQINWDKAPDWAKWWAVDSNGVAFFYDVKPKIDENYSWWNNEGVSYRDDNSETYKISGIDWRQTLTRRPAHSEKPNNHCTCKRAEFTRDLDQDSDAMCGRCGLKI